FRAFAFSGAANNFTFSKDIMFHFSSSLTRVFIRIVVVDLCTSGAAVLLFVQRLFPVVFNGSTSCRRLLSASILFVSCTLIDRSSGFYSNDIGRYFIKEAGAALALLFAVFISVAAVTKK